MAILYVEAAVKITNNRSSNGHTSLCTNYCGRTEKRQQPANNTERTHNIKSISLVFPQPHISTISSFFIMAFHKPIKAYTVRSFIATPFHHSHSFQ